MRLNETVAEEETKHKLKSKNKWKLSFVNSGSVYTSTHNPLVPWIWERYQIISEFVVLAY